MEKEISKEFVQAFNGILKGEAWVYITRYTHYKESESLYARGDYNRDTGKPYMTETCEGDIYRFVAKKNGDWDKRQTGVNYSNFGKIEMCSKNWKRV